MTQITFQRPGQLTALPPLSLYIHIPWCIKKCPYCDFNSHSLKNGLPEEAYIDALLTDLQIELPNIWGRPVETIFFGGGTPSLFQAKSIDRLLSGVRSLLRLHPEAEITLEANPGTFEIEKFQGFKDAGITRLSIGVQSFNDDMLARLGRVHNGKEALTAIDTALKLFDKVNIDLMYVLPNQTVQTAFCPYRISVMPPTAAAQPATSEICSASPKNHAEDNTPKIGTSVMYAAALPAPKVFTPSKYHA